MLKGMLTVAVFASLIFSTLGAVNPTGQVALTFLNCPKGATSYDPSSRDINTITVYAKNLENANSHFELIKALPSSAPVEQIALFLPRGVYSVEIHANACGDQIRGIVVGPKPFSAVAIGRHEIIAYKSNERVVTGKLPFRGFSAAIIYTHSKFLRGGVKPRIDGVSNVTVNGRTFIARNLHAGHALLRLYNSQRTFWLDFDLGNISRAIHKPYIRKFDVTEKMVEDAAQFPEKDRVFNLVPPPGKPKQYRFSG